jgi:hypothetical protein
MEPKLCECGCGNPVSKPKNRFIYMHHSRVQSVETRNKISESLKGENHHMYGKRHTEESKNKMSESKKKISKLISGKNHHMYGKTHTTESKKKMSESRIGSSLSEKHKLNISIANSGPNNANWKNGVSYRGYDASFCEPEYKSDILKRDRLQCQCPDHNNSWKSNSLVIHHIDFDPGNSHPNNLITLCRGCHRWKAHGENKKYYLDIFNRVIQGLSSA